jgi:hypothetical protein
MLVDLDRTDRALPVVGVNAPGGVGVDRLQAAAEGGGIAGFQFRPQSRIRGRPLLQPLQQGLNVKVRAADDDRVPPPPPRLGDGPLG